MELGIIGTVIEVIHLPGMLRLRQSLASTAGGLEITRQWYHLLTPPLPRFDAGGSGISGL